MDIPADANGGLDRSPHHTDLTVPKRSISQQTWNMLKIAVQSCHSMVRGTMKHTNK